MPAKTYTVKLEGAEKVGYRTIFIGATRDPVLISQIEKYLGNVHQIVEERANRIGVRPEDYRLFWRIYGKNGVMRELEPEEKTGHELCLIAEVIGRDQETANTVLALARMYTIHSFRGPVVHNRQYGSSLLAFGHTHGPGLPVQPLAPGQACRPL